MIRVKICGISDLEGALAAVEAGAHALGFVFADSPRRVEPEAARAIVRALPPFVVKVGVFVNAPRDEVEEIAGYCGLDALQFHGDEPPEYCAGWRYPVIKAFRLRDRSVLQELPRYRVSAWLLDAFVPRKAGGTGITCDWGLAREAAALGRVILAGGITPENVKEAIRVVRPFAVDVSSGVESDGRKDPRKIRSLLAEVRRIEDELAGS
ncbi:MAG: phosphoribosylanthranilate isomerase [Thermacetogeniaceae bacterium]